MREHGRIHDITVHPLALAPKIMGLHMSRYWRKMAMQYRLPALSIISEPISILDEISILDYSLNHRKFHTL